MDFAWLDIVVLVVVLISSLLAMVRGFAREMFSIISWGLSIVAAFFLYEPLAQLFIQLVPDLATYPALPLWSAGICILIVTLIILSFITSFIADKIIDSRIGSLDRTLGFIFGFARGIVLMAISLVGFLWLANSNIPSWVEDAKSKPILESIALTINNALPENFENKILTILKNGNNNE